MRLLKVNASGELSLTQDFIEHAPCYAILSHTWGRDEDEVTFDDLEDGSGKKKTGYTKIQFCREQAEKDGLQFFWVDTCCIDKRNHVELSEAISSMFRWYRDATKCYVYLSDVSARRHNNSGQTEQTWELAFRQSRWFTRGWTLQELLAPESLEFFSQEGEPLGDKKKLEQQIHEITGIPITALRGTSLSHFSVNERMRWAAKRQTKREEDKAYSLMGIFDVFIPLIYGEGENAFIRLKEEINMASKVEKSLNDLDSTDPLLDMERIEDSKDPLLKECCEWIFHDPTLQEWRTGDTTPLLWICGDPGKGKTMLTIALVRHLLKETPSESSTTTFFFCQASDPRLNNISSILRGLIWKLAAARPHVARVFVDRYGANQRLFNGPNAIYNLFSTLSAMLEGFRKTFLLIDALDECNSELETDLLLRLIIKHTKSFSRAKWLLTSRNYPNIKQILHGESQILSLELNAGQISVAVAAYIEKKTRELATVKGYSLDLKEKVEKELTYKADSTFLWVALACKSIRNVTRSTALSKLRMLPPGLQNLYAHMLEQVLQNEEETKHLCLQVLRSISLAFRPLSIEELVVIAELPVELCEDNGVFELIEYCRSFIIIRDRFLSFVHHSARDYLVISKTSKLFPTGFQEEHGLVVSRSLDAMSRSLKKDMGSLRYPGFLPNDATIHTSLEAVSYACSFWIEHLAIYLNTSPDVLRYEEFLKDQGRVHDFLLNHLLHWFEALSLIGDVDRGVMGLYHLERLTRNLPFEICFNHRSFVLDAIRFVRRFRSAIEEASLQVYSVALVYSPENSLVRQNFKYEILPSPTPPRIQRDWGPHLQTLESHTGSIRSVAFSPSGEQLATCSDDGTVRLWNAVSWGYLHALKGHTSSVKSVVFSPSGEQLASCSDDGTVRLWDAASGACLQTLEGHTGAIKVVTFSPSGQQLASCSDDGTVRLWDAASGACLQTLEGHTGAIKVVTFSPSGLLLASASYDQTIRLWDPATGRELQKLEGHSHSVTAVAFGPDGSILASSSSDMTVRLWDMQTHITASLKDEVDWERSSERLSEVSEVSSAYSLPSLVSDSSPASIMEKYSSKAAEHLAALLSEDPDLSSIYEATITKTGRERFHRNHDRLLKAFFKNLRSQVKNPIQLAVVRSLRNRDRRHEITLLICEAFEPSIPASRKFSPS